MSELTPIADADGVRTITLNRPERRNALNVALLEALRAALADAAAEEAVRVVVLAGAGKGFCAGADVTEWSEAVDGADDTGLRWERNAHALVQELHDLPKPTVAVLQGAAVGAGLDLACACDFRVASEDAVFFCAYTWVGYNPDAGGTWLYPRLMGLEAAKRFVYTGERWDAATAHVRGLVSEVVPRRRAGVRRCAPRRGARDRPGSCDRPREGTAPDVVHADAGGAARGGEGGRQGVRRDRRPQGGAHGIRREASPVFRGR